MVPPARDHEDGGRGRGDDDDDAPSVWASWKNTSTGSPAPHTSSAPPDSAPAASQTPGAAEEVLGLSKATFWSLRSLVLVCVCVLAAEVGEPRAEA